MIFVQIIAYAGIPENLESSWPWRLLGGSRLSLNRGLGELSPVSEPLGGNPWGRFAATWPHLAWSSINNGGEAAAGRQRRPVVVAGPGQGKAGKAGETGPGQSQVKAQQASQPSQGWLPTGLCKNVEKLDKSHGI